jgi:hypothetical protein
MTAKLQALGRQVPYLGFCFTENHVNAMHEFLSKQVYTDMQKEDSPLYQASMVIQLESKASDGKDEDDEGDEKTPTKKAKAKAQPKKAKAKTTPKGQPKKKAKKGKNNKEDGDDAELEAALKGLEAGADE